MMWKPNDVSTGKEISPGRSRNATSSNSLTMTPRRNQPSSPSCAADALSFENRFAVDRKSPRLNSSHQINSYAAFCFKKQNDLETTLIALDSHVASFSRI